MNDKELCHMEIHTALKGRNFVIMLGSVSFLGHAFFLASFSWTFVCGRGPETHRAGQFTMQDILLMLFQLQDAAQQRQIFLLKTFLIIGPKNENSLLSPDGRLQLKCDGTR